MTMSVQTQIEKKLTQQFSPEVLTVENESHRHSGPATESHFKITIVSQKFIDLRSVQRHQQIYRVLGDELNAGVHALALHTYTPEEWNSKAAVVPPSPNCQNVVSEKRK